MTRSIVLRAALLFGAGARAAYSEYFFTSEASSWMCDDETPFGCKPPQVCAFDNVLNKHVCCDPGKPDAVCWSYSTACSSNTINCSEGNNRFCCLADKEICTKNEGQINICWATAPDPFASVGRAEMNKTFSSLLSASPSAKQLTLDLDALLSTSTPTPTASGSTTPISSGASTPTASSTNSNSPPTPTDGSSELENDWSSDGVSVGAIAGGVIGGALGLALVAGIIFFLMRRKRAKHRTSELDGNPYAGRAETGQAPYHDGGVKGEGHYPPQSYAHEADSEPAPVEMPAHGVEPMEMEGSRPVRH